MQKIESIITIGIIVILCIAFVVKVTEMAFKYLVALCGNAFERIVELTGSIALTILSFFGLVPNFIWATALTILIAIGLIYVAIKAYHSLIKSSNATSIVEIKGFRAIVSHRNGAISAITFDGAPINSQQIAGAPQLTNSEKNILQHLQRKIDNQGSEFNKQIKQIGHNTDYTIPLY